MNELTLAAAVLFGVAIGIGIVRVRLAWWLTLLSVPTLHRIIEKTGRIYEARWKREFERRKRLNFRATGRHLIGVPLQRSATEEVLQELRDTPSTLESRKL